MKWTVFIFGLLFFVLSGCSFNADPPTPTPDIEATIQARTEQTQAAQETIQAAIEQTQTAVPTATATTTPTELPTPTEVEAVETESEGNEPEAVIMTADTIFKEANVYSLGFPQDDVFLVTIEVPGGVEDDYYALVDGKQYECQVLEQYPDRLYCSGQAPQTNRFVIIQIMATDSEEVVFEAEIGVPAVASLPAAPGNGGGNGGNDSQPPPADPPKEDPPPPPDNPKPPSDPYPYP